MANLLNLPDDLLIEIFSDWLLLKAWRRLDRAVAFSRLKFSITFALQRAECRECGADFCSLSNWIISRGIRLTSLVCLGSFPSSVGLDTRKIQFLKLDLLGEKSQFVDQLVRDGCPLLKTLQVWNAHRSVESLVCGNLESLSFLGSAAHLNLPTFTCTRLTELNLSEPYSGHSGISMLISRNPMLTRLSVPIDERSICVLVSLRCLKFMKLCFTSDMILPKFDLVTTIVANNKSLVDINIFRSRGFHLKWSSQQSLSIEDVPCSEHLIELLTEISTNYKRVFLRGISHMNGRMLSVIVESSLGSLRECQILRSTLTQDAREYYKTHEDHFESFKTAGKMLGLGFPHESGLW